MLTRGQIQVSVDIKPLLDIAADCLRFVTEFFEVISQSAPRIYYALLLSPQSSVVRKLYGQYIRSTESMAVTGIPTLQDLRAAGARAKIEVNRAVWSPSGQLIAVGWVDRVELRNLNTLECLYVLEPPSSSHRIAVTPYSLAFSPDGHTLACTYYR